MEQLQRPQCDVTEMMASKTNDPNGLIQIGEIL